MWMNGEWVDYKTKEEHLAEREALREKLKEGVPFGVEVLVRRKIQDAATKGYTPKNTASRYLEFMNTHVTNFSACSVFTEDEPYIFRLVSSIGNALGDTVEECMDELIK